MDAKTMNETLLAKATELRDELIALEKDFNLKKEQYLKIQGALEALSELESPSNPTE
jgi:hypothetical protein